MRTKGFIISLPLLMGLILYFSWSELRWSATQFTDTPEAYASYLEDYPSSEHRQQALACIDELEWRLTEGYEGMLGYEYYLDRLPNGPHADAARAGLQAARLSEALAEGTKQAVQAHMDLYPKDKADPGVQLLLERLAWRGLLSRDSSESFRTFLAEFPAGQHAQEAQDRLDRINFSVANLIDAREHWQAYLATDPPEHFLEQARVQLDELYWEAAAESPRVMSLRVYLRNTLQERHLEEARDLLEELVWEGAHELGTRSAIAAYLKEFPDGIYHSAAQLSLEEFFWSAAVATGTPQSLNSYLEQYPQGSHVDDVPVVRERLLWGRAEYKDEIKAYEEYLQHFPLGAHASQAQQALVGSSAVDLIGSGELAILIVKVKPAVLELKVSLGSDSLEALSSVTVGFPVGLVFKGQHPGAADLAVLRPAYLRLRPGETKSLLLNTAMLHGTQPGAAQWYAATPVREELIERILERSREFKPASHVMQLALWIAMDDLGYEELTSLKSLAGKGYCAASIAEAMELCRVLGLPISKQRIWSERSLVRAELPDGPLRKWLSHPESVGDAIRFGNTAQLGKLLEAGANPNQTGSVIEGNTTALALAMELERLDLGQQLLTSGADVNASTDGESLVLAAVRLGRTEWLRLLLENGAALAQGDSANAELMLAVSLGETQVIELLIEAGAPLNGSNEFEVPLNHAAASGQLASVQWLIERQATLDRGIDTALMLAAEAGHLDVLRALVDAGAEIDRVGKWGYTALHKSVEHGKLACVKVLLAAGSQLDREAGGFRPIDLAAFRAGPLVEFLAAQGAAETLFSAVARGDLDGIERSLAKGESLERWGAGAHRPLHVAVIHHQGESLERLLKHGADVNARTTQGLQALHYAVQRSWPAAIQALVERGGDPNDPGFEGTPLQLAVAAGDLPTVKLLLALGADPARKRAEGMSALELAQQAAETRPRLFAPLVKLLKEALGR